MGNVYCMFVVQDKPNAKIVDTIHAAITAGEMASTVPTTVTRVVVLITFVPQMNTNAMAVNTIHVRITAGEMVNNVTPPPMAPRPVTKRPDVGTLAAMVFVIQELSA